MLHTMFCFSGELVHNLSTVDSTLRVNQQSIFRVVSRLNRALSVDSELDVLARCNSVRAE